MGFSGSSSSTTSAESSDEDQKRRPSDRAALKSSLNAMYAELGIKPQSNPGNKLCGKCINVIATFLRSQRDMEYLERNRTTAKHYLTFGEVQRAAQHGCALCAAFTYADLYPYEGPPGFVGVDPIGCHLWNDHEKSEGDADEEPEFFDPLETRLPWPDISTEEGIGRSPGRFVYLSKTSFGGLNNHTYRSTRDGLPFCRTWLEHCLQHHEHCRKRSAGLPTRLVDVRGSTVKLCLGSEIKDQNTSYATLSHCWGGHNFMTLTKQNFSLFLQGIPMQGLTKTFQEAIETTRYLGLDYIWIDSLCIIQDSPEDWEEESTLMAGVYGNATLNIAATAAVDGRDGLFFNRPTNWRCQIQLKNEYEGGIEIYDCLPRDWDVATSLPLTKRAWVVQERCLSHRTIHFTKRQVFWECNGGHYCESKPTGYWSSYMVGKWHPEHSIETFGMDRRNLNIHTWCDVVQTYTACQLTKQTDKLAAIAGFAKAVQQSLKRSTRYIAGMWEEGLLGQLVWRAQNPGERNTAISAPSWSWASVDAVIKAYFHGDGDHLNLDFPQRRSRYRAVMVESIEVQYTSPSDEFASVASAVLRLRCEHLYHGTLQPLKPKSSRYHPYNFQGAGDFVYRPRVVEVVWDLADFSPESSSGGVEVYLFHLMSNDVGGYENWSSKGLVLRPRSENGLYERVGYYEIDDYIDQHIYSPKETEEMSPSWLERFIIKGSKELLQPADCIANREDARFSCIRDKGDGSTDFFIDIL